MSQKGNKKVAEVFKTKSIELQQTNLVNTHAQQFSKFKISALFNPIEYMLWIVLTNGWYLILLLPTSSGFLSVLV
jgi:hypothetical protein